MLIFEDISSIFHSMKEQQPLNGPPLGNIGVNPGPLGPQDHGGHYSADAFAQAGENGLGACFSPASHETGHSEAEFEALKEELAASKANEAKANEELAYAQKRIWKLSNEAAMHKTELEQLRRMQRFEKGFPGSLPHTVPPCAPVWEEEDPGRIIDDLLLKVSQLEARLSNYETMMEEKDARLEEKDAIIVHMHKKCKGLEEKAMKPKADSGNSGVSPSQDPNRKRRYPKPRPKGGDGAPKKRPGGQPGHKGFFRSPFDINDPSILVHEHEIIDAGFCPCCGAPGLEREPGEDKQHDMFVLPSSPIEKHAHIIRAYKCQKCGKTHYADTPREVAARYFFDIGLISKVLFLRAYDHLTTRGITNHLKNMNEVDVCPSFTNKLLKECAVILRPIFLEMKDNVKFQGFLNIDETVYKCEGERVYVWGFAGPSMIYFQIGTRSAAIINEVLTEKFRGVFTSDAFCVYTSFVKGKPDVELQLCMAHLRREFNHCLDYEFDPKVSAYGKKGMDLIDEIFHSCHLLQKIEDKDSVEAITLRHKLENLRIDLTGHAANPEVVKDKASGISKRFKENPQYYFTFYYHPESSPTNNYAEQSVRRVVIERKISCGTQSLMGIFSSETFWTLTSTLILLNMNGLDFFNKALTAHLLGKPLPSLVNPGGTVDPKYLELRDKELVELKQRQIEIRKILEAKRNKVRPFDKAPEKQAGSGKAKKSQPCGPVLESEPKAPNRPPETNAKGAEAKPKPKAEKQEAKPKPKAEKQKAKEQKPSNQDSNPLDCQPGNEAEASGKKPPKRRTKARSAGKKPKRTRRKASSAAKIKRQSRPRPKAAKKPAEETLFAAAACNDNLNKTASECVSHGTSPPFKKARESAAKAPEATAQNAPPRGEPTRRVLAPGSLNTNPEACPHGPHSFPGSPRPEPERPGAAARRKAGPSKATGARRGNNGQKASVFPPANAKTARPRKRV
jgi:transposase